MTSILHVPREKIQTSTKLPEIMPTRRRRTWRAIERETGLRLPQLRRPAWVARIATAVVVVLGVAVPVLLSLSLFGGAILTAILSMIVLGNLFAWLTKPLAFEFHSDCTKMGQLAALTLALNYRTIAGELNESAGDEDIGKDCVRLSWKRRAPIPANCHTSSRVPRS